MTLLPPAEWPLTDLHAHIIAGVDDGPRTDADTANLLRAARSLGITTMVATPHLKHGLDAGYARKIDEARIQAEIIAAAEGMQLEQGFEVLILPDLPRRIDAGEKLTLADTRTMLVELPFEQWPLYTDAVLFELETRGIRPLMAHPERYLPAIDDPSLVLELADKGVAMQVTWSSLTGVSGKGARNLAHMLIERNLVDVMATDAHSVGRRLKAIPEALSTLIGWVGEKRAWEMAVANPLAILNDDELLPPSPIEPSSGATTPKGKRWFG